MRPFKQRKVLKIHVAVGTFVQHASPQRGYKGDLSKAFYNEDRVVHFTPHKIVGDLPAIGDSVAVACKIVGGFLYVIPRAGAHNDCGALGTPVEFTKLLDVKPG